ncbi:hypothetical protein [Clavibacter tessellarius]|uniref:hypothetical protein n=1 Tax=Clavibacter tessellarius TaxID=31965 RepID=UPI00324D487D
MIDLQPGRTDFLTQAKRYESVLAQPGVGLALDPEWRLGPDQVPLKQIGSVSAAEVDATTDWLAGLVRDRGLPQKMLVLHQFRLSMITDRASLDTSHPEARHAHPRRRPGRPARQAGHLARPARRRARRGALGLEGLHRRGRADAHARADDAGCIAGAGPRHVPVGRARPAVPSAGRARRVGPVDASARPTGRPSRRLRTR